MKYLIIGLGRSGKAAAKLLKDNNDVTIWDSKTEDNFNAEEVASLKASGIKIVFGNGISASGWDELILSPGVPRDLSLVLEAEAEGAVISGEIELAYEHCKGSFFAITGTNGKTTVTSLVGEMVKAANLNCFVAGNIGNPLAEVCSTADENSIMVTEISSFQLETVSKFHPHVAAVLNLTPDHLDRHKTFENYAAIKARITENQDSSDYFVYNLEDDSCIEIAENTKAIDTPFSAFRILPFGAFVKNNKIVIRDDGRTVELCKVSDLQIPGHHNLENALAAAAIAYFGGIPAGAITKALKEFKGVPHRMEFIRELRGIRYVNDSKGTNPDSSIKAIEATDTSIVLIAGGYEKNSDYHEFIESFDGKVRELLLIGATAERFRDCAIECGFPEGNIRMCRDMKDCIQKASLLAMPGDTVLLSPASASWGMYKNFEERGDDFRNLVNSLS